VGTGYLDIETTGVKADNSMIIAAGILIEPSTTPNVIWAGKYEEERGLLEWLKQEIKKCDKIVTWFGSGFDIPFIITRGALYGVTFPELAEIDHLDLCLWSQHHLLLSAYSLKAVAAVLGISAEKKYRGGEIPVLFKLAKRGNSQAAQEIVEHCVEDITSLKQVYDKLKPAVDSLGKYQPLPAYRADRNAALKGP
jgi:uncharacterized protein YprB with RNaseH-like and TPR domain